MPNSTPQSIHISFSTNAPFKFLKKIPNIINERQNSILDEVMKQHGLNYRPAFLVNDLNKDKDGNPLWTDGIQEFSSKDLVNHSCTIGINGIHDIHVTTKQVDYEEFEITITIMQTEHNESFILGVGQYLVDEEDMVVEVSCDGQKSLIKYSPKNARDTIPL